MSQAKSLAEKIDKQTEVISEAELARGQYRDELAEVYLKINKLPAGGGPSAPENPGSRRAHFPNGSSFAVCHVKDGCCFLLLSLLLFFSVLVLLFLFMLFFAHVFFIFDIYCFFLSFLLFLSIILLIFFSILFSSWFKLFSVDLLLLI